MTIYLIQRSIRKDTLNYKSVKFLISIANMFICENSQEDEEKEYWQSFFYARLYACPDRYNRRYLWNNGFICTKTTSSDTSPIHNYIWMALEHQRANW